MMDIMKNKDIYCLIGDPVSKSLSPVIHNNYFKLLGKNSIYFTFNIKDKELDIILKSFKILDIKGFNVTIPHKIRILDYLDEMSEEAEILGAVNTVKNQKGRLIGYNTDGIGFIKSLELEEIQIKDKNILILGAGGAAYAISISLAKEGISKMTIANRTISKAISLSERITRLFPEIDVQYDGLKLENTNREKVDLVINCTAVGMYPNIDESPIEMEGFSKDLIVYDIVYKPRKTKLLQLAESKGHHTINGISMLINQALCSQEIWNGKKDCNFVQNYTKIRRILEKYVE